MSRTRSRIVSALAVVAVASLSAGCRQDMHQAPRYDPLEQSDFFADQRASRPLVEHTVARGFLRDDTVFYTGKLDGQPVEEVPAAAMAAFGGDVGKMVARGQERFNIYCSPCHSQTGDGTGMIVQRGYKQPSSFHIDRLRAQPLGYFYDVITIGFATMPDYAAQVAPQDRWAIAAYIRTLQYSRHAPVRDVPAADRTRLDGDTAPAVAPAAAPAPGGTTSHE